MLQEALRNMTEQDGAPIGFPFVLTPLTHSGGVFLLATDIRSSVRGVEASAETEMRLPALTTRCLARHITDSQFH